MRRFRSPLKTATAVTICRAPASAAKVVARLVHCSFRACVSADWSQSASGRFVEESSPERLRARLRCATYAVVARSGRSTVGFMLMSSPTVLSMLFVQPEWMRLGIGRELWQSARAYVELCRPDVKTIELNSSPYALRFYDAMGFIAIAAPFEVDGTRATRMAYHMRASDGRSHLSHSAVPASASSYGQDRPAAYAAAKRASPRAERAAWMDWSEPSSS